MWRWDGRDNCLVTTPASGNPFVRLDDASADIQRFLMNQLVGMAGHHEIQRVRSTAFELFAPTGGERLLDAGCGAGEVARQLAARVGSRGSVVALDRSAHAISVAESQHDNSPVTYTVGDIMALDFPDGHFDGVRSERVLQHLSDPDGAIKELARVTRPGGRVCVIDTDWASMVWDGFDYLDEVTREFRGGITQHNDHFGHSVRSRMVKVGLQEVTTVPVTLRFTEPDDAAVVTALFNRRLHKERLSAALYEKFFTSVDQSVERGDFLFAFTMWISLGRVQIMKGQR
jgi:ubiquinone/menaquinone biosynthesis C-methylase UbiE